MFLKRMPIKCKNMAEDIKMNSFAKATDAAYIYAESSNGSQVKIKKSDLVKLIADSLLIVEPIYISTKKGIEVDTGIDGTHIVSIFYIEGGSPIYEHIISISSINNNYKIETLTTTWYSDGIITTVKEGHLFVTQNKWESIRLYLRVLR